MELGITELQMLMIVKIAESEFTCVDGAKPKTVEETVTWMNVIVETNQDKGVAVSLDNKKLIDMIVYPNDPRSNLISLTETGLEIYNKIKGEYLYYLENQFDSLVMGYQSLNEEQKTMDVRLEYITKIDKIDTIMKKLRKYL